MGVILNLKLTHYPQNRGFPRKTPNDITKCRRSTPSPRDHGEFHQVAGISTRSAHVPPERGNRHELEVACPSLRQPAGGYGRLQAVTVIFRRSRRFPYDRCGPHEIAAISRRSLQSARVHSHFHKDAAICTRPRQSDVGCANLHEITSASARSRRFSQYYGSACPAGYPASPDAGMTCLLNIQQPIGFCSFHYFCPREAECLQSLELRRQVTPKASHVILTGRSR